MLKGNLATASNGLKAVYIYGFSTGLGCEHKRFGSSILKTHISILKAV